ncbi:hypothetical protein ACF0H5_005443 [Mactra antiquata]
MADANKDQTIDFDRMSMISEASTILAQLDKKSMTEIKSFNNPPEGVKDVLMASIILLGRPKSEQTWSIAKKELGSFDMHKRAAELDFEKIPMDRRREAMKYLSKYSYEHIMKISRAAAAFYQWAHAIASE